MPAVNAATLHRLSRAALSPRHRPALTCPGPVAMSQDGLLEGDVDQKVSQANNRFVASTSSKFRCSRASHQSFDKVAASRGYGIMRCFLLSAKIRPHVDERKPGGCFQGMLRCLVDNSESLFSSGILLSLDHRSLFSTS